MTVYAGPVFDKARRRVDDGSADHLEIPADERQRLLSLKRAISASIPVHMDDEKSRS